MKLSSIKRLVWNRANKDAANDPLIWRKDFAGAWIQYTQFRNFESDYGWDIVRIVPPNYMGSDSLSNLLPINCKNLNCKMNHFPKWTSEWTSSENVNENKRKYWKID